MTLRHDIRLEGSRFWITHRGLVYGPFDYEWSPDFCGVQMIYDGLPFGEYCSRDEWFADLKPFQLPMSVVRVTSIVMGCIIQAVLEGLVESERRALMMRHLNRHGLSHFADNL